MFFPLDRKVAKERGEKKQTKRSKEFKREGLKRKHDEDSKTEEQIQSEKVVYECIIKRINKDKVAKKFNVSVKQGNVY